MGRAMAVNMDEITLTERDMLALEWELHHVRWLANAIESLVGQALYSRVNDYSTLRDEPLNRGEMSRSEAIGRRERFLTAVPLEIQDEVERHARERQWWAEHKLTAPINQLRLAVRKEMMRSSSAQGEFDPTEHEGDPPEADESVSTRWLLGIRATIAERRIRAGKFILLFQDAIEREPELGVKQVDELREEFNPIDFGDRLGAMSPEELEQYVERAERAAAAFGITGDHLVPGWIDAD